MADVSKNNPMKEFAFALGGIALFLGIVLLIGISAFLRPAGEHIVVKSATDDEVVSEVVTPDADTATADNTKEETTQAPTATEDQQATDDLVATAQAVDVDEVADTAHEQAADAESEASTTQ